MSTDIHEIYAIRYASHGLCFASENYIGGDPHDDLQPLDYFVWAIVGESGAYVVDTGMDERTASRRRGRTIVKPVGEGLRAIGIDPDKVEHVIITHLHFDHAGNQNLFPRAQFHLQDAEMEYATGRCMCHAFLRDTFDADQVLAMVRNLFDGRIVFHDGDEEVVPGIGLHRIGGHSKGLQCVTVKTKRGTVVLASDVTHLYGHFEEKRVFPIVYNAGEVLAGYETILKLADSPRHIIPGHDPAVLERYPAARRGLEGWVVQLDIDPTAGGQPAKR